MCECVCLCTHTLAGVVQWIEWQTEAESRWSDSQSRHTPSFQARSPGVGAREATTH